MEKIKKKKAFRGSIEIKMLEENLARCPTCYAMTSKENFDLSEECPKCADIMYMIETRKCHNCGKDFYRKTGYNMWFCNPCKVMFNNRVSN